MAHYKPGCAAKSWCYNDTGLCESFQSLQIVQKHHDYCTFNVQIELQSKDIIIHHFQNGCH